MLRSAMDGNVKGTCAAPVPRQVSPGPPLTRLRAACRRRYCAHALGDAWPAQRRQRSPPRELQRPDCCGAQRHPRKLLRPPPVRHRPRHHAAVGHRHRSPRPPHRAREEGAAHAARVRPVPRDPPPAPQGRRRRAVSGRRHLRPCRSAVPASPTAARGAHAHAPRCSPRARWTRTSPTSSWARARAPRCSWASGIRLATSKSTSWPRTPPLSSSTHTTCVSATTHTLVRTPPHPVSPPLSQVVYLEDGDMVRIDRHGYDIFSLSDILTMLQRIRDVRALPLPQGRWSARPR